MEALLQLDPADNVAVATKPLLSGQTIGALTARNDIPAGHKIALRDIAAGEAVRKFGYVIGIASRPIAAGQHVHLQNVQSALKGDIENLRFEAPSPFAAASHLVPQTFDGFLRTSGQAGIRNEIWIVNTVACVNHASQRIAEAANKAFAGEGRPVDGVYAFPHPFGCSQLGDDLSHTQKVLAGLVRHPNAAAVLILGLGCENNQMKLFLETLGPLDRQRIRYFNAQEVSDEIEEGTKAVGELVEFAAQFKRQPMPVSKLILGMKCGGSDGFSGITANPLVGRVADRLAGAGGTALLSEVPEMFGAEEVLLSRACDARVFDETIRMVNDFRAYFRRYDQPIDENPSPGNKAGGITTLAEKSLGCVQKGGRAPVKQVLAYGQAAAPETGGIALVNAPGNDGVSSTAMTIAGAHMILFTTGRGTPMGFPAPTVKISTNTDLATRKPQWIDFNAGLLADGTATLDALADELYGLVLKVASGEQKTRSEQHGYREIAIWKNGVTL